MTENDEHGKEVFVSKLPRTGEIAEWLKTQLLGINTIWTNKELMSTDMRIGEILIDLLKDKMMGKFGVEIETDVKSSLKLTPSQLVDLIWWQIVATWLKEQLGLKAENRSSELRQLTLAWVKNQLTERPAQTLDEDTVMLHSATVALAHLTQIKLGVLIQTPRMTTIGNFADAIVASQH